VSLEKQREINKGREQGEIVYWDWRLVRVLGKFMIIS